MVPGTLFICFLYCLGYFLLHRDQRPGKRPTEGGQVHVSSKTVGPGREIILAENSWQQVWLEAVTVVAPSHLGRGHKSHDAQETSKAGLS